MKDSYCEIILPFRQDLSLREEYINFFKAVRVGKILEDLDALAATIALKHCLPGEDLSIVDREIGPSVDENALMALADIVPLNVVTASMDRMDLLNILRPDLDLKCYGCVTYAGRSSMEVTVRVASRGDPAHMVNQMIDESGQPLPDGQNQWTPLLLCKFTLVAKDPFSNKPLAQINHLVPSSAEEEKFIRMGLERKQRRLEDRKTDLLDGQESPTQAESQLVHKLWIQGRDMKLNNDGDLQGRSIEDRSSVALMKDTRQTDMRICFPQERNMHGSVFGGFLMREAFELAYATATLYIKARPLTVAMDEIAFKKPVPIGSILKFSSEVVYAEGEPHRTFQVSVIAEVLSPDNHYKSQVSNTFFFTFARCDASETDKVDGDLIGAGIGKVRKIIPVTYEESMKWILGRRRKSRGIVEKQAQLDEFQMKLID
ncbi:hypothetical protein MIR68_002624 [Amoeboaphelidium protococcarum]|nr:hypothetical protein MIR68_002624 [Amoeboaphelidium protococcarum]